jgi:hypothetical protein
MAQYVIVCRAQRIFFTVNLLQRYPNDLLVRHIDILRTVMRSARQKRPFVIPLDSAGAL